LSSVSWIPRSSRGMTEYMIYFYPEAELRGILRLNASVKGNMSFVVPGALRPKEREVHSSPDETDIKKIPGYRERLAVRPGLTGLAQVYLPTDALHHEKFQYDLLYIKKKSFLLDLKLIFLSFRITFRGKWESRQKKF